MPDKRDLIIRDRDEWKRRALAAEAELANRRRDTVKFSNEEILKALEQQNA